MNRSTLFAVGAVAAVVFLIIAILYWAGGVMPWPDTKVHVKHGILFLVLAIIAGLFAAVNRPTGALR